MGAAIARTSSVVWLHLSDVHIRPEVTGSDSRPVLNSLISDLQELEEHHGLLPNFIFFTGDLAFGESTAVKFREQFDAGQQFLTVVSKAFTKKVPKSNIFLVPGNHDVNRSAATQQLTDWLDGKRALPEIETLIRVGNHEWEPYIKRLSEYREMLERHKYKHLLSDPNRLIYTAVRRVNGFRMGIVGLNSAWSCCRDGEKGKLWVAGQWQIHELLRKMRKVDLRIALIHHPCNWFCEDEDPNVLQSIEREFQFCLHGHEHRGWVADNGSHTRIAAAACYDRSDRENGYNITRLNLESGEIEIWLRRYDASGGGWVPRNVKRKADDGIWRIHRPQKWLVPSNSKNGSEIWANFTEVDSWSKDTVKEPSHDGLFNLNSYVSRPKLEAEIRGHLKAAVNGVGPRLVTLHAGFGMGKSRLAEACATQSKDQFRDGFKIISLEGKSKSGSSVAEAIGLQLGMIGESWTPDAVFAALHDKQILLILDNYESVGCDDAAEFLRQMLKQIDGLCLLVTSRTPVGLGAEQVVPLEQGMESDEARRLFIARAKLKGGGSWTPDSDADLNRIISATENVPLAIEYAAAWANHMSLARIASQIERSRMPEPPPGFIPHYPRHKSLWLCLDALFNELTVGDRQTFAMLCVFPETFDADAVAHVCELRDNPQVLLFRFQQMALVQPVGEDKRDRYRMHHFTQKYGYAKLCSDTGQLHAVRRRFVQYFGGHEHISRVGTSPPSSADVKVALDWMEAEWRNLRACAEYASQDKLWSELVRLSDAMVYFFQRRGHLQDGESLFDKLSPLPNKTLTDPDINATEEVGRGTILNMLGVIYQFQRRLKEAATIFRESLPLRVGLNEAKTRNSLASVLQASEQWREAAKERQRSRRICRLLLNRDPKSAEILSEHAEALSNLGIIYDRLNRPGVALTAVERSQRIWQQLQDRAGQASAFNSFGQIYQLREDWPKAQHNYQKRLEELRAIGDRVGEAGTLNSLGFVHRGRQQWDLAEHYFREALEVCIAIHDIVEEGVTHRNLGFLYNVQRQYGKAIAEFKLGLLVQSGTEKAKTLNTVGWIYECQGELEEAMPYYEQAENICLQAGDDRELTQTRLNIERLKTKEWGPAPSKSMLNSK